MQNINKQKKINLVLSFLLILILGSIWWLTSPSNQTYFMSKNTNITILPVVKCNFSTIKCETSDLQHKAILSISNQDISAFTPLHFTLNLKGINPDNVTIHFKGIEMFMGANSLKLKKTDTNRFAGTIVLPGHKGHGMTWRAITTMTTNNIDEDIWFEFPLQ